MDDTAMFEKSWYEASPYIYVVVALAVVFTGSALASLFGILLLLTSLIIIVMRINYRSEPKRVLMQSQALGRKRTRRSR